MAAQEILVLLVRVRGLTWQPISKAMEQPNTIESRVASAILERTMSSIEIDGQKYDIAPPTLATLILVSEIVSTLPIVEPTTDNTRITYSVLHHAKNFQALGDIAAVLILGAKAIRQDEQTIQEQSFIKRLFKRRTTNRRAKLAKQINENVRPSVLFNCIIQRLKDNEVGTFFAITTSLSEANLLKPTKEVVN